MSRNEIISIAIGGLLAGFGVFLGQTQLWGYILLGAAGLCFAYVIVTEVLKKLPIVYVKPGKAGEAAGQLYETALSKGGSILATHIFPTQENIQDDFAVKALKRAGSNTKIEFRRILILEDPAQERRIVENIFNEVPNIVDVTLHVLARYPLGITRLTKSSIPRFNILLHQQESVYNSFLGLDDLAIPNVANTNFAIQFKSKKSYESLKSYFTGVTSSSDLVAIQSLAQYNSHRALEVIPLYAHHAITALIKFAEQDDRIIFAGLFGSIAKSINDIFPDSLSKHQDMDVDLMLICEPDASIENIKSDIKKQLSETKYRIIWGDDEKEFYSFRDRSKVNIDVEIFPKGDDFYKRNHLLAYSIFRYFLPLYSHRSSNISDHIEIQRGPLLEAERWKRLLKDRKGYLNFKAALTVANDEIDPRRILSLILRNFVWSASGHYPATAKIAIGYFRSRRDGLLDGALIDKVDTVLSSSYQQTINCQYQYLVICATIMDALAKYAHSKIDAEVVLGENMANKCIQPTLVPRATDA